MLMFATDFPKIISKNVFGKKQNVYKKKRGKETDRESNV